MVNVVRSGWVWIFVWGGRERALMHVLVILGTKEGEEATAIFSEHHIHSFLFMRLFQNASL